MNVLPKSRVNPSRDSGLRRGIILVVVMVVVTMISLAGFGFVAKMSGENKAVHLRGEQLQMDQAIASAEEFLKQHVQRRHEMDKSAQSSSLPPPDENSNEDALMRGIVVADEDGPHSRVRFSVMAPHYDESGYAPWRYGLERESSRLDLVAVMEWESMRPGAGLKALLGLPGMTDAIAEAILDWMDQDTVPRQSGAEQDFYSTLSPSYSPRNGIPESLEELLLIKGVTRSLLFGRDSNQNHHLDPEELSVMNAMTARDSLTEKQTPWIELLTLYSGERNQAHDGLPRINVNHFDLINLHRQLMAEFDAGFATFVVAYRQFGPSIGNLPSADVKTVKPDFTITAKFLIQSPLDLIQARVQLKTAAGTMSTVASPLPTEKEKLNEILGILYDRVTVSDGAIIRGRVNVNQASAEVLRTIPGIDKALAEQIVTARQASSKSDSRHDKHPYWLLTEGLVDLNKMKEISSYLTIGGDVFRAQIVAYSETSRLSQRVEIVLDASRTPTRRVFWKDLQVLGRGYPWDVIDTPGGISTSDTGASDAASYRN